MLSANANVSCSISAILYLYKSTSVTSLTEQRKKLHSSCSWAHIRVQRTAILWKQLISQKRDIKLSLHWWGVLFTLTVKVLSQTA